MLEGLNIGLLTNSRRNALRRIAPGNGYRLKEKIKQEGLNEYYKLTICTLPTGKS